MRCERPFREGDLHSTLGNHLDMVRAEIEALDSEYVLKASPAELEDFFVDKASVEPLILHDGDASIDNQAGVKIDMSHDFRRGGMPGEQILVPGTKLRISVPYDGDKGLWRLRPSHFTPSPYPSFDVEEGRIIMTLEFIENEVSADEIRAQLSAKLQSLLGAVENIRTDVVAHNQRLAGIIGPLMVRRRERALAAQRVVDGLGLSIRRADRSPDYGVSVVRRRQPVVRPAVLPGKYTPEPRLEMGEYEHILSVLRSMSLVMERSAAVFKTLDEETIRTHFLLALNGHYEGGVTGETFNASGKTDILIRADDRNVFVAECKFWHGAVRFYEGIDQLLGYLSWRDTKAAILVFNRNKDSTRVRAEMHDVMIQRPEFRKTLVHAPDGDSRYVLVKASDAGREIMVTTMLFDVPTSD